MLLYQYEQHRKCNPLWVLIVIKIYVDRKLMMDDGQWDLLMTYFTAEGPAGTLV